MANDLTNELKSEFPPDYVEGARNAVTTCLAVRPGEACVLITDRNNAPIAAAIAVEIRRAGGVLRAYVLEEHATRPLTELPAPILAALETADVSFYVASAQSGELAARIQMTSVVNRRHIRHAHMVNIGPRIMVEGMRADFVRIDALSRWVLERVVPAPSLTARSSGGSDLRVSFDATRRWIKTSGLISPEKWGNLPGGEVFTAPARVDGTFVCDGVLGDWLAPKYGDMRAHPMTVEIENSRITSIACSRQEIVDDFRTYTSQHANSNRVGEFALGTNIALTEIIGQILQDEKFPGVHIAFGHPYSEHTGADWSAPSHIDIVGRDFDVVVNGTPIMRRSRYLLDIDSLPRQGAPAAGSAGGNGSGHAQSARRAAAVLVRS